MIKENNFKHTLTNGLVAIHTQDDNGMHSVTIRYADGDYYSSCLRITSAEAHKYIDMIEKRMTTH